MAGYFQPLANIPQMPMTTSISSLPRAMSLEESRSLRTRLFGEEAVKQAESQMQASNLAKNVEIQQQNIQSQLFNPTQYAEDIKRQQEYERSKLAFGQQKLALGQQMLGSLGGFFSNFGKNFGQAFNSQGFGQMQQTQQKPLFGGSMGGGGGIPSFPSRQSATTAYWTNPNKPMFPFSSMAQPVNTSLTRR